MKSRKSMKDSLKYLSLIIKTMDTEEIKSEFSADQFISGSTWMRAQEIESEVLKLRYENERLRQAYDYIMASRNSVDKELHESYGEIQSLQSAIKKYILHWDKYFSEPKVGQPPDLKELRDIMNWGRAR